MIYKLLKIFFLNIIVTFFIYSENPIEYKKILIKMITIGKENNQLGYLPSGYNEGIPQGIGFDNNYNLYISDNANERVVIFKNDYNSSIIDNKILSGSKKIEQIDNNFLFHGDGYSCAITNNNYKLESLILFSRINFDLTFVDDYFIIHKNIIFTYSRPHNLISIQNPSKERNQEENEKNLRYTDETKKLVKSQYPELTIDDKDRLILNNKILTRIYEDFVDFWEKKHINMISPKNSLSYEIAKSYLNRSGKPRYIGIDKEGNTYWGAKFPNGFEMIIFDGNGFVINNHFLKNYNISVWPAIHPLGDVYYLDFDGKSNYLFMVPRTWGYDKIIKGKCTDNSVNIRLRPSITSDVISQLNKNNKVEIVDKTDIKLKANDKENYWYKIKISDNKYGWVFGDFIEIEKE